MADRVDEFLFRGFIPEENRGGTYHVVLNIGGKIVGPLTPKQAEDMGYPQPVLENMMLAQAMADVTAEREAHEITKAELESVQAERDAAKKRATQLETVATAQAQQIASLTDAAVTATKASATKG